MLNFHGANLNTDSTLCVTNVQNFISFFSLLNSTCRQNRCL